MKNKRYILGAAAITILFLIPPCGNVLAADPAQINQISIDDGVISDLGLSLNKSASYIITQYGAPTAYFVYGSQSADHATITLYFYSNDDGTTGLENARSISEGNIVDNQVYYRIISRTNTSDRYSLLYGDSSPELGHHIYGQTVFLDGKTEVGIGATLDTARYTDQQLQTMMNTLEAKAHALLTMKAMNTLHGQITGFTIPLKHITISLTDGATTAETTTDAGGNYNFSTPIVKGKQYTLTVTFSYAIGSTTYFQLHYQENNETVVTYSRSFTVTADTDLTQNIAMDQALPIAYNGDWAKTFASMYVHFTEALEFYRDFLKINIDFQLPLDVYTFVPNTTGTKYWYSTPGKSYITIDAEKSIHESPYRPMNREYHEFSHYIMHSLYQQWPAPAPGVPGTAPAERNHGGYVNPSTSDSYVEGFADFMAAVIMEAYTQAEITIPVTQPTSKDQNVFDALDFEINTQWSGKEINYPASANKGKSEELAITGTLWDLYDENSDYMEGKTPEQMYSEYQQMLPKLQQDYEEIKAINEYNAREQNVTGENATTPPMQIATLHDFQTYRFDDDNVTLGIEAVWDIIKTFHNDFTSVYNDFIAKYPSQKKAIDDVFIAHTIYADTDPGNGVYDNDDAYYDENGNGKYDAGEYLVDCPIGGFHYTAGEVIGQATNYNRLWRQSIQEIPGYFIKVDNTVPFYLVELSYPNNFYLNTIVRARNENGLISIPVPPKGYLSLITIIPEGVQSSVPLNFSSEVFQSHYTTSLAQGYYAAHDFQVTGPIPSAPSMPGTTSPESGTNQKKTPGFEVIVLLAACMAVILLMRKRDRKNI